MNHIAATSTLLGSLVMIAAATVAVMAAPEVSRPVNRPVIRAEVVVGKPVVEPEERVFVLDTVTVRPYTTRQRLRAPRKAVANPVVSSYNWSHVPKTPMMRRVNSDGYPDRF